MKPGDLVKLRSEVPRKLFGPYNPESKGFQVMDWEHIVTNQNICILLDSMESFGYLYYQIYTSEGKLGWVPKYLTHGRETLEVIS